MDAITIDYKNQNIEVFAKIANSLVRKYNCRVKYDHDSGQLRLFGDDDAKYAAIEVLREYLDEG
ncbi:MAG: hypothetical protein HKM93_03440 [Desulfobacteraceae bacterium]|nr:hypothetical protein [Desulfobacteraceae bacterium]